MKKSVIALAVAAAVAAPAAMADVTVYGYMNMSIDNVDVDGGDDQWEVNSNTSRIGFKGSEDLGNGLKAGFKAEYEVLADTGTRAVLGTDGQGSSSNDLKRRNQYVFLSGGFGEFRLGRHDTPLKVAQGKFDLFNNTVADIKSTIPGENRVDNAIAYITPSFGGFTALGALIPGEGVAGENGLADSYSVAGIYSGNGFYASLGYDAYGDDIAADTELLRALATYTMGAFTVGGLYSTMDINTDEDLEAYGVNAAFAFGANTVKVQYMDTDGGGNIMTSEGTQATVGIDHSFSKRTNVYALYSALDADTDANNDTDVISFGMVHKF